MADKPSDVACTALKSFFWRRRLDSTSCYDAYEENTAEVSSLTHQIARPTFVRQCDSLHSRDSLPIFQLQDTGVVPSVGGGDGLLQGRSYAAESAGLAQLTTLILVHPGNLFDL